MAQWIRIWLPMQETRAKSLVWEDSACCGATKPICIAYWDCALDSASCNYRSPHTYSLCSTTETMAIGSLSTEMKSNPCSSHLEKACAAMKTQCNQEYKIKRKKIYGEKKKNRLDSNTKNSACTFSVSSGSFILVLIHDRLGWSPCWCLGQNKWPRAQKRWG